MRAVENFLKRTLYSEKKILCLGTRGERLAGVYIRRTWVAANKVIKAHVKITQALRSIVEEVALRVAVYGANQRLADARRISLISTRKWRRSLQNRLAHCALKCLFIISA